MVSLMYFAPLNTGVMIVIDGLIPIGAIYTLTDLKK
jgi:hypothetical protein